MTSGTLKTVALASVNLCVVRRRPLFLCRMFLSWQCLSLTDVDVLELCLLVVFREVSILI